jgi:K+-sensing histidine kinase KdpD
MSRIWPQAVTRFFETGNLMALRRLALRQVAGVTDQRMLLHKR